MAKLDSIPPSLTSFTAPFSQLEPTQRLIVLVPDLEWDYIPAIHRVRELANSQPVRVSFISLCKDSKQELSLRRELVILSAMVQDGEIPVEMNVEIGNNWVDAVKRNYRKGDTIVCFAEHHAGLLHQPLAQILESNLRIPIDLVSGIQIPKPKSNRLAKVTVWLGSMGIAAAFGFLQVRIVQLSEGWFQTILLTLVVIFEICLIWVWDRQFG